MEIDSQGFVKASGDLDIFNRKQKEVGEQSNKTEKSVNNLNEAFNALSPSSLAAVAGVTALISAVKSLVGVGSEIINVTSQFEQTQKSLETVLQSAEKGQALFEDLRKFSFDTTFGVDELASASSQLLNVGVGVEKLQGQLKMLGDLAQGDKNKFAELTSIFAKVQSTGKASAMQLQQFALRGIPIIQTLKDMGVQGTASAEQLTEAFEKLTGEGGQFHDAMNNIIDTIEGKKGFIADTIKEIYVNFGELTGITDTYKKALDVVYEILNKVNEKLIEWKDNPMMNAIMSGALATIIGTLTATILTALGAVIVKLGIIKALLSFMTGPLGIISLIAGATVGLIAGVTAFNRAQKEQSENTERFAKACQDAKKAMEDANNLRMNGIIPQEDYKSSNLKKQQEYLSGLVEGAKKAEENIEKTKKAIAELEGQYDPLGRGDALKEELAYYEGVVERNRQLIKYQTELVKGLEDEEQKYINLKDSITEFADLKDSLLSKDEQEIKNLEEKIKWLEDYKKQYEELNNTYDMNGSLITFDDDTRMEIDRTIKYFQDELDKVMLNIKIANMDEWKKDLMKLYGFDNETVKKLLDNKSNGSEWVSKGLEDRQKQREIAKQTYAQLGINQSKDAGINEAKEWAKTLVSDVNKLVETGRFGAVNNSKLDNASQAYLTAINDARKALIDLKVPIKEVDEIFGNISEETEIAKEGLGSLSEVIQKLYDTNTVGGYAGGKAISMIQGTAVGQAAEGAMEGLSIAGPWGALIGAILGLLSSMENWKKFLDEIDEVVKPLKPILNAIIGLLIGVTKPLEAFAEPIEELLSWITQIVRVIDLFHRMFAKLITVINTAFEFILVPIKKFASAIEDFVNWLADVFNIEMDISNEKEDELARIRALNDAYSNMLTSLRDVEEEYEKRRKQINSQTYAEGVTGVHDMILTPQGKFSTDPDDYIIATKNPSGLNGGGSPNVIINNYSNSNVETRTDDNGNLIIQISQKVAYDYANGNNGWDSAVMARQARVAGRNLAM